MTRSHEVLRNRVNLRFGAEGMREEENDTGKDLHKDPDRRPAVEAAGVIHIAVSWFARLRSDHPYLLAVLLISVMAMWVSLWLAAFS